MLNLKKYRSSIYTVVTIVILAAVVVTLKILLPGGGLPF